MLTEKSIKNAVALGTVMTNNGLSIAPKAGTPLALLVTETRGQQINISTDVEYNVENAIDNILYMANCKDSILNTCPHDLAMDSVTETLIDAIKRHIVFSKTVVAPVIDELASKTIETIEGLNVSKLLNMNIVTWSAPEVLVAPAVRTELIKYDSVIYDNTALKLNLPSLTLTEIGDLLKTGNRDIDSSLVKWFSVMGEGKILSLWADLFQFNQNPLNNNTPKFLETYLDDKTTGTDTSIFVYFLTRKMYDNPIAGVEMSLAEFNEVCAAFRNQAGSRLVRALAKLDSDVAGGLMVRSSSDTTIVVDEMLYRDWLEKGGDNDVLFGNTLGTRTFYSVGNLTANAEKLKADWMRHSALVTMAESGRKTTRFKQVMLSVFTEQISRPVGNEATEVKVTRQQMLDVFNEELNRFTEADLSKPYDFALRLVCRSRFPYTDAERILGGIDKVVKQNPNMNVSEAATISIIDYIAYWISTQIECTLNTNGV